jgi:4-hydroxyphenylacetate 3-monooxygenase
LEKQQAVQEKLATLAVYREGINAFLTAAVAEAEESPGGLLMPNQSLLYAGRVHACSGLAEMMHITRDLCGGQICVTPDFASFTNPEAEPWLRKFYTINEDWQAEDRRKLLAYARDLLNSDYAGHRLTFQLFAQSPPFAHLLAVYRNFDFAEPMRIVRESSGLSEQVDRGAGRSPDGEPAAAPIRVMPASTAFSPVTPNGPADPASVRRHEPSPSAEQIGAS